MWVALNCSHIQPIWSFFLWGLTAVRLKSTFIENTITQMPPAFTKSFNMSDIFQLNIFSGLCIHCILLCTCPSLTSGSCYIFILFPSQPSNCRCFLPSAPQRHVMTHSSWVKHHWHQKRGDYSCGSTVRPLAAQLNNKIYNERSTGKRR